jgi:hypothetical protein
VEEMRKEERVTPVLLVCSTAHILHHTERTT